MAKKKKVKSKQKTEVKSSAKAKSMQQLEKENDIIFNKKHIWMRTSIVKELKQYCEIGDFEKIAFLFWESY